MSNEAEAPEHGYLICKYGMLYRPDSCGYTSAKSEAGRYSLNEAIDITHPNGPDGPRDGMTYIHETDVPDARTEPSDAKDKRIAELEAERDEWQKMVGKIAAAVPLPDTLRATATLGDLVAYITDRIEAARAAEAKLAKLEHDPLCAKCGHPKSNHHYRHPFQELKGTDDE